MDIIQQIDQDLSQALKDKNELAVLTLRQVKTAFSNAEIANNREKLKEADILKILKSEVKKRKEAIELYKKGGRQELAEKESKEIDVLSKYLPEEISADEIEMVIDEVISQLGEVTVKDIGKIIGQVVGKLKGQADGSVVSQLVKAKLTK